MTIDLADGIDEQLAAVPNCSGIFLIHTEGRDPYLARTALLRRRLLRLLAERTQPSRLLSLRSIARRVDYWPTASRLETAILFYRLARQWFPQSYLEVTKLRMPSYVKLVLSNAFPRTHVTTRLSGGNFFFGPFRTRSNADDFQTACLDLFQLRRCQEDLEPSPNHPGCIYGEMNMCLRPCQEVVGPQEYRSEVRRVKEFLSTGGHSLLEPALGARDQLSAELRFEEAAREHTRVDKIEAALKLRDPLAASVQDLCGVAITPCLDAACVELWFVTAGCFQPPVRFRVAPVEGEMVPLDRRLREAYAALPPAEEVEDRQEHLALLARWFYSSWRDGEWLSFEQGQPPYRKLVRVLSRVAASAQRTS
ncbi:MAG: hypothetical protein ABI693_22185 [Bryobacteraceae bacterium]